MKKIALILAFITFSWMPILAQGFSVKDGKVSWQLVYTQELTEGSLTIDDIFKAVLYTSNFRDIVKVGDDTIVAELKSEKLDVEDYGFKRMKSPLYMIHYKVGPIAVRIEAREGRYRVTADNIRITNMTSNFAPIGAIEDIEEYVITEAGLTPQFYEYVAPMLGEYFLETFLFKKQEEEEW